MNRKNAHSYLNVADFSIENEIIRELDMMKSVASKLYNIDLNDISNLKRDKSFKHYDRCWRFNVSLTDGSKNTFYVKSTHKTGPVGEALGMTLSNILLEDANYNFIISNNGDDVGLTVTDNLKGVKVVDLQSVGYQHFDAFSFGVALELSNALGLYDRHSGNLMVHEKKMFHIDFGRIFSQDTVTRPKKMFEYFETPNKKKSDMGRKYGRQMITERFLSNKVLIENILKEAEKEGFEFTRDPLKHLNDYIRKSFG
ncbi:MAG: hypothetical protein ABIB43_05105 [archaeon]